MTFATSRKLGVPRSVAGSAFLEPWSKQVNKVQRVLERQVRELAGRILDQPKRSTLDSY